MKHLLMSAMLLYAGGVFSQDTVPAWIRTIDPSAFKMYGRKQAIPKDFYPFMNIRQIRKIANPSETYFPGCTNPVRGQLHWAARQNKRWVFCMTHGSNFVSTRVYFFDSEQGKLRIRSIRLAGESERQTTFGQVAEQIKSGNAVFEIMDPADFD